MSVFIAAGCGFVDAKWVGVLMLDTSVQIELVNKF